MAYDDDRQRLPDNLRTELAGGRTVEEVIAERYGKRPPDERRTKLDRDALDEAMSYLDPAAADQAARDFIAKHGR